MSGCRPRLTPESLLDLFLNWTPDNATQRRILVDNPARLYNFGGEK